MELRKAAEKHDWEVEAIYEEKIAGATTKRPQLDALMTSVIRQDIDVMMTWVVSRLGQSLQHLAALLSDFQDKGVELYLHQN
jgi:DNA invertase Pin-like site-specific DNA recombinase